ncbi:MAG TPA: gamma-glutamyltransferase [Gemmatimonadales bacterium]|nr:gamma-glutamyltransferase [Gemmatimonadales bacterium]
MTTKARALLLSCTLATATLMTQTDTALGQAVNPAVVRSITKTQKPPLHGRHWMAITGKPLGATAGAMMFQRGGNAVDAACGMLAAVATMWDMLSWGGETQALIYHPGLRQVIGINALGAAPSGATPDYFAAKKLRFPPEQGVDAMVTPGTPGGLMVMLAEYGTLSLKEILAPAIEMADGYAIEAQTANSMENNKKRLQEWPYSKAVMLPHPGQEREAPEAGEIFRQVDLAVTLRKLVDAEQQALQQGKSRKEAIMAAYDRFYKGDIAEEYVRGAREQGSTVTKEDLASWRVRVEEPVSTSYKGIEVYKLNVWTQGPALLQALNILEHADLKAMGYNSSRYVHALYQAMNLAFADRDFYYGDIYFPPEEPVKGLLSKEYARQRYGQINWSKNDADARPGDPYPFQGGDNPYKDLLAKWTTTGPAKPATAGEGGAAQALDDEAFLRSFYAGTTSIQAADSAGWVVSITPSGGWVPAVIAGRTGVGMSQRAQSFVTDPADNPYNVVAPGKRPRVTLTPSLALKDGLPYLSFAVQGGDSQDQNLLQFFLNVVEWEMTPQQAAEAANINSYQMRGSFGQHESRPGRLLLAEGMPDWVRAELRKMGYTLEFQERTSGPINAIWFDRKHGSLWGGSSNHGEDYGIAW